jgi:hypothetical protein
MSFESLSPYLAEEKYPYEMGTIRGFAFALVSGDSVPLLEEFRMRSCGQGVNSKVSYQEAVRQLQEVPELLESLGGLIPFPTRVLSQDGSSIEVQYISVEEALERISSFS